METPDESVHTFGAIRCPSLRELLDRSEIELDQVAKALDLVNHFAYGHRHASLMPSERRNRLYINHLRYCIRSVLARNARFREVTHIL
jgi:hypothetical protein